MTAMSSIPEFDRSLFRKRCEEGIQQAKAKGTKCGRPMALEHCQRRRIAERYSAGETLGRTRADRWQIRLRA
jgi:DNA invertase Pin-like site-specific DNA recombinase